MDRGVLLVSSFPTQPTRTKEKHNMSTLANIARTVIASNLTRNELKVIRARLRRAGLTNLTKSHTGPYTVNTSLDVATDARAVQGTILVQAIAEAA